MSQAYCEAESDKRTALGPSLTLSVLRHMRVDALSPDFPRYWAWPSSAHFQGFLNTSTHSYYVSGVCPVVVSIPKAHVHHHSEDKQPTTLIGEKAQCFIRTGGYLGKSWTLAGGTKVNIPVQISNEADGS